MGLVALRGGSSFKVDWRSLVLRVNSCNKYTEVKCLVNRASLHIFRHLCVCFKRTVIHNVWFTWMHYCDQNNKVVKTKRIFMYVFTWLNFEQINLAKSPLRTQLKVMIS